MTTPAPELSEVEHLKSVYRKVYNRIVDEQFEDFDVDDLNLNINIPRQSLKRACKVKNDDSQIMINNRIQLFYLVLRTAQDLQAPIYGVPVGQAHESRKYKPQICLYFREDLEDVDPNYRPITAEIKFRLMDETEESITKAKLTTLANKIKSEFGLNNGYRWHKGRLLCVYTEPKRGYHLHIYAFSVLEAKEVISKVLDIQSHTPDWKFLKVSETNEESSAYPIIPPNETILGKVVRLPRRRPVGYVRFLRATCAIWGLTKPVALFDRTGLLYETLVN